MLSLFEAARCDPGPESLLTFRWKQDLTLFYTYWDKMEKGAWDKPQLDKAPSSSKAGRVIISDCLDECTEYCTSTLPREMSSARMNLCRTEAPLLFVF